jgi:hypothetical protein
VRSLDSLSVSRSGKSPEAEAAINALNGENIGGRHLTVNVAKPREERDGSRGRRQYGAASRY